jgi:hypothetical protein
LKLSPSGVALRASHWRKVYADPSDAIKQRL